MYNLVDLSDKTILITGASSGMGRETAVLCSKLGAKVILVARQENRLVETIEALEGDGHNYYSFDLTQLYEIESFIKKIILENGKLDGFVHSAGITSTRPLKSLKLDINRAVMDINYFAFVEFIRCITKRNCFNNGLSIVGISSISAKRGNQAKTAYCASKAAMDAAVKCMAKELAPKGIRVNSVNPALIRTNIYDQFVDKGADSEDAKNVLARQYLGLGEPIDVANMIAYLLSNAARFITGSNVDVDGGSLSS